MIVKAETTSAISRSPPRKAIELMSVGVPSGPPQRSSTSKRDSPSWSVRWGGRSCSDAGAPSGRCSRPCLGQSTRSAPAAAPRSRRAAWFTSLGAPVASITTMPTGTVSSTPFKVAWTPSRSRLNAPRRFTTSWKAESSTSSICPVSEGRRNSWPLNTIARVNPVPGGLGPEASSRSTRARISSGSRPFVRNPSAPACKPRSTFSGSASVVMRRKGIRA